MRKGVDSFDTTFTEVPCGNSACGYLGFRACRFRFAASERKANTCRLNLGVLVLIRYCLNTHESGNGLRGSSVKNCDPLQTLD